MSDEVRATSFGCCDHGGGSDWIEWIIIIAVIFCLLGGTNIFGGRCGCCR
ncbi:MAG: hypothetical protein GX339_06270 [Tissierellia bacterium]|nr:hypothetical protein [Tissierellia bacterium]